MSEVFRIVYCSQNTIGGVGQDAELEQILETSRRNNAQQGVTGALLYTDGIFAQVLEGPFEVVQEIFERIQFDPRHDNVVMLQAESVERRVFEGWAMAHAKPHDPVHAKNLLSQALAGGHGELGGVIELLDRVVHSRALVGTPA